MRKDRSPLETINIIKDILYQNNLTYHIAEAINNNDLFYSVRVELDQLVGVAANGKGMRDYRTGLYCVTKCCKARNYRLF